MTLTFRRYLESIQKSDASALEVLSWGAGVADSKSWAEAMAALKHTRRATDMRWAVRFLWHDYIRVLARAD